jgi:hypothetical protein
MRLISTSLLGLLLLFASCTSVQTRTQGKLLVTTSADAVPEQFAIEVVESHDLSGLAVGCWLTAIFYGGACWGYLGAPFDNQRSDATQHLMEQGRVIGQCVDVVDVSVATLGWGFTPRSAIVRDLAGRMLPPNEVRTLCSPRRKTTAPVESSEALRSPASTEGAAEPATPAAPAATTEDPADAGVAGFGGLGWGSSTAAFLEIYKDAKQSGEYWTLSGPVAGLGALTLFRFVDDQLAAVVVVFTDDFQNKTNFLYEHERIRKLLEKKYGSPNTASRDIWTGDGLYRETPGEWGMAVATGRLSRWSVWELPETEIELGTKGDNFKITNKIVYRSTRLKSLLQKQEQAKALGGL